MTQLALTLSDSTTVEVLLGFAERFWVHFPQMSVKWMKFHTSNFGVTMGATEEDIKAACTLLVTIKPGKKDKALLAR